MILTQHGINSLNRGGGGNTLRLPYLLDIAAFDVDALKDGDVQWSLYRDNSKPVITKEDGALSIKFEHRLDVIRLNLDISQFANRSSKYAVEIDFDSVTFNGFLYSGPSKYSAVTSDGSWFTNTGLYVENAGTSNVVLHKGRLNGNFGDYSRYDGFSNTYPKTVKWVVDEPLQTVEIYFDDVLQMSFNKLNLSEALLITFNSGGNGNNAITKISGLRIYNVT